MGNTSSHPSNSTVADQLSAAANAPTYPAAASGHGEGGGRQRSGTRDRGDRDRDVPVLGSSPPPPPPTPLLLPYAGHFSPQNPHCLSHPQVHDFGKVIVTQLILDNQLAPFYRGLDDYEEDWTELDVRSALDTARDKDYEEDVKNSYTARLKEERQGSGNGKKWGSPQDKAERARREDKAYLGAVECPICFLNYPPNINTSRCCQQPLCTECFVQIKRGEATVTHLESEPACCPYCVETDFGVIYERPSPVATLTDGITSVPQHALATSPDAGASGFSALSVSDEPGSGSLTPKTPTPRRKSVSSKAKEVITIDQIRPDWEAKLNAVKAQAARRAARRIVMRQVGDRLIPIGYTSSRATGQADFSMSLPPQEGRRERRTRERERELEEMMIMEAMRLSMIDHEEHQRKIAEDDETKPGSQPAPGMGAQGGPIYVGSSTLAAPQQATQSSTPSSSRRSSSAGATLSSWRAAQNSHDTGSGGRAQAAASKLLNKINVTRSRANSKSSVHFAPSPTTLGVSTGSPSNSHPGSITGHGESSSPARAWSPNRNRSSSNPSPNPMSHQNHVQSPLVNDVNEAEANAGSSSTTATPMILQNSIPVESPEVFSHSDAFGLLMPILTPDAPVAQSGPGNGTPASPDVDADTPSPNTPPSNLRTAANPDPELAALMAEAAEEDPDRQPSPSAASKTAPQGIPEANASSSDLISVSSLASTPPGAGLESRPRVPLSAMADDEDDD